jgi:hypothetical protein
LLFEGVTKEELARYIKTYEKMQNFLIHLKENNAPLEGNIEVRVKKDCPIPSITFYILKKNKRDTVIFYLGPCVELDGKAWRAFQTQSEAVYRRLNHEFQDQWELAKKIKLENILEHH